jgi:hypothetical protein
MLTPLDLGGAADASARRASGSASGASVDE